MTKKKRFGVSIPINVAKELDEIAFMDGVDRSSIITRAVTQYLHEDKHIVEEHECSGMIIYYGLLSLENIAGYYDKIVKSLYSVKLREGHITVVFVEGPYGEIEKLRKQMTNKTRRHAFIKYLPLYCAFNKQSLRNHFG
ncbi:MAG: hypothetical protein QXE81_05740 [Desulfurococcaceae archaeon]